MVNKGSSEPLAASEFRLLFGKYKSTYEMEDEGTQERSVATVDLHDNYNSINYANDIAIVWLAQV